ncbi:ATP-binding cassette sub-family C member 2-like [Rhipicephalus sanguineus]|uniref:ATP-binding cassette sub-family C member 2-like n=1 Tax=Rhipicephalus sanguineus TaxID=34632 RepID=UPI0020C4C4B4|nr:ATP-binding cassette sub-family C member 2-like [Rhipicephalus sanguineus]
MATTTATASTGTVRLEKCTLAWNASTTKSAEPQLKNVTLDIEPGSLVGVVGFVGSGKSSLLSAILGDMQCLEGNVERTGRIAYVPQLPNVHNMTIRDNILYGRPMHPGNYERVLRCCQLMNDLNKIPAGDAAEVGEKGTNLSGGQKQRISLARAAYSNSDVYLLDDPLSALDPVVANVIFREVLGPFGLLRNKTGWQLLMALIRFSQWPALAGVAVLAAAAVANAMQQLWIKSWTDASSADPDGAAAASRYWIGGLVGICVASTEIIFKSQ